MEEFELEANITIFQRKLENTVDPPQRKVLKELITEHKAKLAKLRRARSKK
jgi:hypothetical protein